MLSIDIHYVLQMMLYILYGYYHLPWTSTWNSRKHENKVSVEKLNSNNSIHSIFPLSPPLFISLLISFLYSTSLHITPPLSLSLSLSTSQFISHLFTSLLSSLHPSSLHLSSFHFISLL